MFSNKYTIKDLLENLIDQKLIEFQHLFNNLLLDRIDIAVQELKENIKETEKTPYAFTSIPLAPDAKHKDAEIVSNNNDGLELKDKHETKQIMHRMKKMVDAQEKRNKAQREKKK